MFKLIDNLGHEKLKHDLILAHRIGKRRKAGEPLRAEVVTWGTFGPQGSLAGRAGSLTVSGPSNPTPAGSVHSPFSSSAAKKAARQSSRVTTGPQNQLGVQETTNLWRQKGVVDLSLGLLLTLCYSYLHTSSRWAEICIFFIH